MQTPGLKVFTVVCFKIAGSSLSVSVPSTVNAAAHTCVRMISDNGYHPSTRTVCVVRVVPTADSKSERMCVLLTVSSNRYRLTHTYLIQPSLTKNG